MSFIFGGNTNLTYDDIQRKRAVADQLLAGLGTPRNVGEGLSAIGKALAIRGMNKQASKADAANRDAFNSKWAGLFGGGAPGVTPASAPVPQYTPPPPVDPASPQAIAADTMKALGKAPALPGQDEVTSYIAQKAQELGIDPSVAVAVARSEGLGANPADGWQSNVTKNGVREPSFGPFQLYTGGGLGNQFIDQTGLDPRDPTTWQAQVDFALGHAAQNGWGAWYGAANTGIGDFQGIPGQGAQPSGQQGGLNMATLAEIAGDPYASPGQKAIVNALLQQQLNAGDPAYRLDLELKKAQLEAARNPEQKDTRTDDMREFEFAQQNPEFAQWLKDQKANGSSGDPASFVALKLQAQAAGLQEGSPEYQAFMLNGGKPNNGRPAGFEALHYQALAAGFEEGSPEYKEFMATRGAGLAAEARAAGTAKGEDAAQLDSMKSKMAGLEEVVAKLDDLAGRATYTQAGQLLDSGMKQLGLSPRDAAVARAEYIAMIDNQILPLLRDTFGAAFTQKEGETLRNTLGDPDKSPAEKQATLRAFIEQKRRDIEALQSRTGDGGDLSEDEMRYLGLN